MTLLTSYLTFNGNCREAMLFYQRCLGGELVFQTVGDSPEAADMPEAMRECILQATLKNDALLLMGSDMVDEEVLVHGNTVSLLLHCNSDEKAKQVYEDLSAGGIASHPLSLSERGTLTGGLTDRYGQRWIFLSDSRKTG